MEGGHIRVTDREGNTIGRLAEGCYVGQFGILTDGRIDRHDERPDNEREATITLSGLRVNEAQTLEGRKVAVFLIEE